MDCFATSNKSALLIWLFKGIVRIGKTSRQITCMIYSSNKIRKAQNEHLNIVYQNYL